MIYLEGIGQVPQSVVENYAVKLLKETINRINVHRKPVAPIHAEIIKNLDQWIKSMDCSNSELIKHFDYLRDLVNMPNVLPTGYEN